MRCCRFGGQSDALDRGSQPGDLDASEDRQDVDFADREEELSPVLAYFQPLPLAITARTVIDDCRDTLNVIAVGTRGSTDSQRTVGKPDETESRRILTASDRASFHPTFCNRVEAHNTSGRESWPLRRHVGEDV